MKARMLIAAALASALYGCATGPLLVATAAGSTAAVAHDRRTAGRMLDDQGIEMSLNKTLGEDAELKEGTHVNVTCYNGVVLLTGETRSRALADRVVDLARHMNGVRVVHDELVIAEPSSVGDRADDSWITTKVKSKLVADDNTPGTRVKVVTERNVVYLMGLVRREEANLATRVASGTQGVERVVRVFEYLD